ncbi:MAG: serpin family protein [Kiritimatiellae bacterium]|nr:serpin family protein [Kiritimatiellia bacterium]
MAGKSKSWVPMAIAVAMALTIVLLTLAGGYYPLWKIRGWTVFVLFVAGVISVVRTKRWPWLFVMLFLWLLEGSIMDHVDVHAKIRNSGLLYVGGQSVSEWRWDRIYRSVAAAKDGKNIVISPCGIASSLALVGMGAEGDTAKAFGAAFSIADEKYKDSGELHKCLKGAFAFQSAALDMFSSPDSCVEIADSLWLDKNLKPQSPFAEEMRRFGVTMRNVDMATKALEVINSHVRKATNGRFERLLESAPSPDTRLIAVNTVYFHGKWMVPFKKRMTSDGVFHAPDGDKTVPFMHSSRFAELCEHEGVTALRLPYQGNGLEMVFVLPPKDQPLEAVEARFDAAFLNLLVSKSREAFEAEISLPKFEFGSKEKLKDAVVSMGLGVAFSNNADFSGISSEPLMLSDIIHKASIRVDEDGTEAVAATATKCVAASAPEGKFIADRPFLFALREKKHGLVLFVGRVVSP